MDIRANKRKIWNMWENILVFACVITVIILLLSDCKKAVLFFLILALSIFVEELIRMRRYNNIVENGEILVGRVCACLTYQPWTYIQAEYIEPETEQRYTYSTISIIVYSYELRKLLADNSEIYIIADRYMKKRGIVLIEEFLKIKESELEKIFQDDMKYK